MTKRVMVCGIDCYPGDGKCNGYCQGKVDNPPEATKEQKIKWSKYFIQEKLKELEKATYDFYIECEPGPDKEHVKSVYEKICRILTSF